MCGLRQATLWTQLKERLKTLQLYAQNVQKSHKNNKWIQAQAQLDETSFYRWTLAMAVKVWNVHIKVKSSNLRFPSEILWKKPVKASDLQKRIRSCSYLASWLARKLCECPTVVNGLFAANLPPLFRHFACLFAKICKCFVELRSSGHWFILNFSPLSLLKMP